MEGDQFFAISLALHDVATSEREITKVIKDIHDT
jgi:hypothetical protein